MDCIDRGDIQGNVLEGYSYPHVLHWFGRFGDAVRGRCALAYLRDIVTTAVRWSPGERPSYAVNIGLSAAGLRALGVSERRLEAFPCAFRAGMHARAHALGDNPLRFEAPWRDPWNVHLWLWVHADSEAALQEVSDLLQARLSGSVAFVSPAQRGDALFDSQDRAIEHFGFRDGISGPSVEGSLSPARPGDGTLTARGDWRPLATGEFLLGHRDESGARAGLLGNDSLGDNGTFAVFRKLGQDVAGFRSYLEQEAVRSRLAGHAVDETWIAARMVGRQRDGTPLIGGWMPGDDGALNAFTFGEDPDGRVCPLGAHIRRANPRGTDAFAGSFARHRILRRGMPFGPQLPTGTVAERASHEQAYGQRGLLFVALNADIERQFEFLQRLYMNDGAAARQGTDTDPLVGARHAASGDFIVPGDPARARDTLICSKLPRFVECLGGEYLFLPGLRALDEIADHHPKTCPACRDASGQRFETTFEHQTAASSQPEVQP